YTNALLSCEISEADGEDAALRSIPGNVPDLFDLEPACIFAARCGLAEPR
ncbi:oligopeptide ABC transporter ATP-binding protein OppD, partial [Vibrio parahaemolyticus]